MLGAKPALPILIVTSLVRYQVLASDELALNESDPHPMPVACKRWRRSKATLPYWREALKAWNGEEMPDRSLPTIAELKH
jgi:hypothetical protein